MGQYTSYYLYQKYESRNGQDPVPCSPSVYSIDADGTMEKVIKLENDLDCGYTPPTTEPIYRWYQMPISEGYVCAECETPPTPTGETIYRWVESGTTCIGYDKWQRSIQQYSEDEGETWYNVDPPVYSATSLIEADSQDCGYVPIDYSTQYFTISYSGSVGTSIKVSNYNMGKIKYSHDNGATWETFDNYGTLMSNGDKLLLKGSSISTSYANGMGHISIGGATSGSFELYGNIMSLVYGDDFADKTSFGGKDYVFKGLLSGNTEIQSATNLIMPATTLSNYCYYNMFNGCTSLITAPELPATTLASYCYKLMFNNCTNLNYIKCLATDISATDCTSLWVQGVSSQTGTFVKSSSMSSWTTGISGIPSGWTVQDA